MPILSRWSLVIAVVFGLAAGLVIAWLTHWDVLSYVLGVPVGIAMMCVVSRLLYRDADVYSPQNDVGPTYAGDMAGIGSAAAELSHVYGRRLLAAQSGGFDENGELVDPAEFERLVKRNVRSDEAPPAT